MHRNPARAFQIRPVYPQPHPQTFQHWQLLAQILVQAMPFSLAQKVQKWRSNLRFWQDELPWLDLRRNSEGWRFGCSACHQCWSGAADRCNPFTQFTVAGWHLTNFRKHATQPAHCRAIDFLSGKRQDVKPAPDLSEFTSVREKIMDGKTTFKKRMKQSYKLAWCLYQAIKLRDIAALKRAKMICLFRDERKTRLAVSARLVAADLTTTSLAFGHRREVGTGAQKVTLGTYKILKDTYYILNFKQENTT